MSDAKDVLTAAREWIIAAEGGYVNDPADPGGETKFGISKRAYPMLDVEALTEADAWRIYERDYWALAGCPQLPAYLALAVFDGAVNQGVRTAVRILQLVLRVTADGVMGERTVTAAVEAAPLPTLSKYIKLRWERYTVTRGHERFLRGWTFRMFDLMPACLELVGAA